LKTGLGEDEGLRVGGDTEGFQEAGEIELRFTQLETAAELCRSVIEICRLVTDCGMIRLQVGCVVLGLSMPQRARKDRTGENASVTGHQ
jgi:hypothetical protein